MSIYNKFFQKETNIVFMVRTIRLLSLFSLLSDEAEWLALAAFVGLGLQLAAPPVEFDAAFKELVWRLLAWCVEVWFNSFSWRIMLIVISLILSSRFFKNNNLIIKLTFCWNHNEVTIMFALTWWGWMRFLTSSFMRVIVFKSSSRKSFSIESFLVTKLFVNSRSSSWNLNMHLYLMLSKYCLPIGEFL